MLSRMILTASVLFILIAFFFLCPSFYGQHLQLLENKLRLEPHRKLYDVFFSSNKEGWVVGSMGLVLHTEDGGATWSRQNSGIREDLFSLSFLDEKNGWIAGANGAILHTVTGGKQWEIQKKGTNEQLFDIHFSNAQNGFSVGSFGILLRTGDGGFRWEKVELDWKVLLEELIAQKGYLEPHLYDVFFFNERKGWIVGELGLILHTQDGGQTWSVQHSGGAKAFFKIFFADEARGWVVGQNGTLLYTKDGGLKWRDLKLQVDETLLNVLIREEHGVITGERGMILKSADGGLAWKKLKHNPIKLTSWLQGVSFTEDGRFVLVGDKGTIIYLNQRQ